MDRHSPRTGRMVNAASLEMLCRLMDELAAQFDAAELSNDSAARDLALASLRTVAKQIDALSTDQLGGNAVVPPTPVKTIVSEISMT